MKYLFKEVLTEGLIKDRPNRFIFNVEIDGKIEKCHCPSTGKIGDIRFDNITCLLSKSENPERKTKFTVEAISVDSGKSKNWIGINQTRANDYVGFFLKNNLLREMVKVREIRREVKLANSRVDFLVNGKDFLEVKTPLTMLEIKTENPEKRKSKFASFYRMVKHFDEISSSIENSRAIFLMCFLFNAPKFKVPENPEPEIVNAAKKAFERGLENWQINLKIDKTGVELIDYFKLSLFS